MTPPPATANPEERIFYRVFFVIGCLFGLAVCPLALGAIVWVAVGTWKAIL